MVNQTLERPTTSALPLVLVAASPVSQIPRRRRLMGKDDPRRGHSAAIILTRHEPRLSALWL